MLSLSSLVSRLFSSPVAAPVEAPMAAPVAVAAPVEAPMAAPVAVAAPVEAPVAPVAPVAPLPTFYYNVLAPSGSAVLMARSVCAVNESDALRFIVSFQDERVQIIGGGRYRCCVTNAGGYVYRPIELIDRGEAGARSRHTRNRTE